MFDFINLNPKSEELDSENLEKSYITNIKILKMILYFAKF